MEKKKKERERKWQQWPKNKIKKEKKRRTTQECAVSYLIIRGTHRLMFVSQNKQGDSIQSSIPALFALLMTWIL